MHHGTLEKTQRLSASCEASILQHITQWHLTAFDVAADAMGPLAGMQNLQADTSGHPIPTFLLQDCPSCCCRCCGATGRLAVPAG